MVGGSKQR